MKVLSLPQVAISAVKSLRRGVYPLLARVYRHMLGGVCFVGVTGSCGKTSTKELAAAVLSAKGEGLLGIQIFNQTVDIARTILSVRPSHSFCIEEIGASAPGQIAISSSIFRPRIAAVTLIGFDHLKAYRSLEAIAEEKVGLVEALPADGTAVLNADDPLVWAMREKTEARVIGFGLSPEATVRGEDIRADWPERLSLTVVYGDERHRVQTQLLGDTAVGAVLGALAIGLAQGIPLAEGVRRLESVEPVFARKSPHTTANGVTFINDACKAPYYTLPATLDFMRRAQAKRKVMIFGSFSDYAGSASSKYRKIAREALEIADKVIFHCPMNGSVMKLAKTVEDGRLMTFDTSYELNQYLHQALEPGDLVMVKSGLRDHHERLIMDRVPLHGTFLGRHTEIQEIKCWRERCGLGKPCLFCDKRDEDVVPLPS